MDNVKRLPDAYFKGTDGNNYKLLHLNELAINVFSKDLTDVLNCLSIMQATGKTLDLYGETVGQKRGALNDIQYRLMILIKIGKNISQSDYNSVIELLTQIFNCKKGDIILKDVDRLTTSECVGVKIEKFPLKVLGNAGFNGVQAVTLIEQLLPVCVKLSSDSNFEGTFELGDIIQTVTYSDLSNLTYQEISTITYEQMEFYPCEYDKNKGFGNVEQTIGGYLSLIIGDDNGFELPL